MTENLDRPDSVAVAFASRLAGHEGTIRDITDNSGSVVDHRVFNSFGKMTSESAPATDFAFGYDGTFWDAAVGMNRMGLRDYDPSTGRFASQDPLGLLPDVNPYRYCGNQPTTYTDPSGLEQQNACFTVNTVTTPNVEQSGNASIDTGGGGGGTATGGQGNLGYGDLVYHPDETPVSIGVGPFRPGDYAGQDMFSLCDYANDLVYHPGESPLNVSTGPFRYEDFAGQDMFSLCDYANDLVYHPGESPLNVSTGPFRYEDFAGQDMFSLCDYANDLVYHPGESPLNVSTGPFRYEDFAGQDMFALCDYANDLVYHPGESPLNVSTGPFRYGDFAGQDMFALCDYANDLVYHPGESPLNVSTGPFRPGDYANQNMAMLLDSSGGGAQAAGPQPNSPPAGGAGAGASSNIVTNVTVTARNVPAPPPPSDWQGRDVRLPNGETKLLNPNEDIGFNEDGSYTITTHWDNGAVTRKTYYPGYQGPSVAGAFLSGLGTVPRAIAHSVSVVCNTAATCLKEATSVEVPDSVKQNNLLYQTNELSVQAAGISMYGNYRGVGAGLGQIFEAEFYLGLSFVAMGNPCGAGGLFVKGANALLATQNFNGLISNLQQGNYLRAGMSAFGLAGNIAQLGRVCFAAGTPLLTPDGAKPIEQFKAGDLILSAPEDDPDAPAAPRRVEEVFQRGVGRIVELRVGGQVIRTTHEHPFYVDSKALGKKWLAACALCPGDLLKSHDGKWVAVESVSDTNDDVTVYNMRIEEYHTYFVGCAEWGFSVWSHNTGCSLPGGEKPSIIEDTTGSENALDGALNQGNQKAIDEATKQLDEIQEAQRRFWEQQKQFGNNPNWWDDNEPLIPGLNS